MILLEKLDSIYYQFLFLVKCIIIFSIILNIVYSEFMVKDVKKKNIIEIDNKYKIKLYEKESLFNKYQTKLKPIAFYYPEYINISYLNFFKKKKKLDKLKNNEIEKLIEIQTKLAKNHGIFGFAIYYELLKKDYQYDVIYNFFTHKSNFPFFLIWKNDELENISNEIIMKLINNLKKLITENYIRIRKKPVLSISRTSKYYISKYDIKNIREKARKNGIGEIFIFYPFIGNFKEKTFFREFDAAYDFSMVDLFEHKIIKPNILYYSGIIYKNLILNKLKFNFSIFRSCYLNYKRFGDYNPEKFYIANKLIFEWSYKYYNESKGIIFIDSWNDYKNGKYLEPEEKFGYSSINAFSKAIFNLPFQQYNFSLYIHRYNTIAIQVHVFYEDLLMEIINKLNIIPFKFDLFVSTISEEKKQFIEKCLINSKINNYEITIFKNKGRDVFPFLSQMKKKYKYYKYLCHIHTKKSNHKSLLGANWRNYIYSNLIGNKEIVSNILFDFETNKKLGFIFPETYYDIIKDIYGFDNTKFSLNKPNIKYMNKILEKILGDMKVGEKLEFPAGNMFWAKTKAIYQIFNVRFRYPKELNQTNETIMHGIERIWLYLVKLNGYYYKTIFKHF